MCLKGEMTIEQQASQAVGWMQSCGFALEESVLLKCPHYPKQSTDSIQLLSKNPMALLTEIGKIILKSYNKKTKDSK